MVAPAGESLSAFDAAEEIFGQEIQTILKHPDDVLHSFFSDPDEPIDLSDLQAPYIQHLRSQREELLRTFRIKNGHEILRDPDMFFKTIVSEFQEQHAQRRAWGRGEDIYPRSGGAAILAESAHVAHFEQRPGSLQPLLWTTVSYQNNKPVRYSARTRLHRTEDWQYVFHSSAKGLEVFQEGYERGETKLYPIGPLDSATLLQALGVEMLSSITDMHQYKKKVQAVNHEIARRRTHELVHRSWM